MTSRQRLVLVLLLGTQFMLAIDFSVLNVAIPAIGHDVGLSLGRLQWVATAFALPAAGFTLLLGRAADIAGRRRMFQAGLLLLCVASVAGASARSPAVLLGARFGQGVAAAAATPAAMSLLVTTFPEGPLRRRALGLNGALLSAGFTAGALLGGVLTGLLSWRWAFGVNVPVALLILMCTPHVLPETRAAGPARLDVPGAVTVTGGLFCLVYGIATGGTVGWDRPAVLAFLFAAAVLLAAFWLVELRSPHPLASLRILRRPTVTWGNLGGLAVFSMESSVVFLLTLYLQRVLGYSALVTGLVFAVPGATAFTAGLVAARLLGRQGRRAALVTGLAVQGVSTLALVGIGPGSRGVLLIMTAGAAGSFGHVYGIVSYMVTATSGLGDHEQGLATGLTTMTQQVALTLGIPVIGTIATSAARTGPYLSGAGMLHGIRVALAVDAAATLAVAAVIGLLAGGAANPARTDAAAVALAAADSLSSKPGD
jgi:MFS family permease